MSKCTKSKGFADMWLYEHKGGIFAKPYDKFDNVRINFAKNQGFVIDYEEAKFLHEMDAQV